MSEACALHCNLDQACVANPASIKTEGLKCHKTSNRRETEKVPEKLEYEINRLQEQSEITTNAPLQREPQFVASIYCIYVMESNLNLQSNSH